MEQLSDIVFSPPASAAAPERIRAIVSVKWAGLTLKGLKVVQGEQGLFVSTPADRRGAKWSHYFFFEDKGMWQAFQARILDEYRRTAAPAPVAVGEVA